MAKKKGAGSAKRFGARYGATKKHVLGKIEAQYKKAQKCPYCRKIGVKRLASGIWNCRKCESIFTGRAYSAEITPVKRKVEEEPMTVQVEAEEQ